MTTTNNHPTAEDLTTLATRRTAALKVAPALTIAAEEAERLAKVAASHFAEADKGFLPTPGQEQNLADANRDLARQLRELAAALEGPSRADEVVPGAEKQIRELVEAQPGLRFGYIGNLERWGDDRLLYVWIEGQREANGNLKSLWCCEAKRITRRDLSGAKVALRVFAQGYAAGKA